MHCIDGKDYSTFSVLPPYNVIHAQLLKKGEPPVPVTTGVTLTYQATADALLRTIMDGLERHRALRASS